MSKNRVWEFWPKDVFDKYGCDQGLVRTIASEGASSAPEASELALAGYPGLRGTDRTSIIIVRDPEGSLFQVTMSATTTWWATESRALEPCSEGGVA